MKSTSRGSPFWSRLLGLIVAFAIGAVMIFGGVKNLMTELSAVYDALADSQSQLAVAQSELRVMSRDLARTQADYARTQADLADTQAVLSQKLGELDHATEALEATGAALQERARQVNDASRQIRALYHDQRHLQHALSRSQSALQQRNQVLVALDRRLRDSQTALEELRNQPKVSVVVTTEKQYKHSYRELRAASQTQMLAAGDGGMMVYANAKQLHTVESQTAYAERTQVVVTRTIGDQDTLACLQDGACPVLASGSSAISYKRYAYQARYQSASMLMMAR